MVWFEKKQDERKQDSEAQIAEIEKKLDELTNSIDERIEQMDKVRVAEYLLLMGNTRRLFVQNLIAGIGRGLGAAIGATVVFALVIKILAGLVGLDLPLIGDLLSSLVEMLSKKSKMLP